MFPRVPSDRGPSKRKRVLLVVPEPSARDSFATLLSTMGWTCAVAAGLEDVLPVIERESLDAVLLDLSHFATGAEHTIRRIKEIRPSLSKRIVAISSATPDPEVLELIERYDLSQLSEEHLLSRLWTTLEDLVASPTFVHAVPKIIQKARLLFDSFRMTPPLGVRSSSMSGRHFTYQHNHTTIDVLVDAKAGSNRISLVGQVLDSKTRGKGDRLPVVLCSGNGALARTTTNHLGEFNLEFDLAENVSLEIRIGERSWISIPLQEMDWTKKRTSNRATGT